MAQITKRGRPSARETSSDWVMAQFLKPKGGRFDKLVLAYIRVNEYIVAIEAIPVGAKTKTAGQGKALRAPWSGFYLHVNLCYEGRSYPINCSVKCHDPRSNRRAREAARGLRHGLRCGLRGPRAHGLGC
mgnify:CR=1 FL=1